ncbi:MAG: hypothetical protein M1272_05450 [Firmicutes bacterium]|nr:hypothetical protein [Bacillota bacterium]
MLTAWLAAVLLVAFLYLGATALWFNRPSPLILGMPPLVFWFLVVPIVTPLVLGTLYLFDRRYNPQQDYFTDASG